MKIIDDLKSKQSEKSIPVLGKLALLAYISVSLLCLLSNLSFVGAGTALEFVFNMFGAHDRMTRVFGSPLSDGLANLKVASIFLIIVMGVASFRVCAQSTYILDQGIKRSQVPWVLFAMAILFVALVFEPSGFCFPKSGAEVCGMPLAYTRLALPVIALGVAVWATPYLVALCVFFLSEKEK